MRHLVDSIADRPTRSITDRYIAIPQWDYVLLTMLLNRQNTKTAPQLVPEWTNITDPPVEGLTNMAQKVRFSMFRYRGFAYCGTHNVLVYLGPICY